MADETTSTNPVATGEDRPAPVFPVAASPDALVGENTEVFEVEPEVNDEPVAPQKVGEPAEPVTEVPVYEVVVNTDRRVDYVIVPPEGRGDATLPIHQFIGARTVEEVFAESASENQDEAREDTPAEPQAPAADKTPAA